jgi:glyoxylase-like metal-dependent hydrolase (beta-lactamase superfamily II)
MQFARQPPRVCCGCLRHAGTLANVDRVERTGAWFPRMPGRLVEQVAPGFYRVRTRGGRAYLAVDGRRVLLFDVGAPGSAEIIAAALRELGHSPADVALVVVSHAHLDHAGALNEVRAMCNAPVAMHAADADEVASVVLRNPFVHPHLARLTEPVLRVLNPAPSPVDIHFTGGERLPLFGGLRVVHMPGHTPGSIALLFESRGIVAVGDAIQHRFGELLPPSPIFTRDMPRALDSIQELADFDFDVVAFSHFRPLRAEGGRRVRLLAEALAARAVA